MHPPDDRFTQGVLDAEAEDRLPLGGKTLYRAPWVGALVGLLMVLGAGAVSWSSVQDLRRWADAPVPVEGAPGTEHLDQWVAWTPGTLACADTVVQIETRRYRAVPLPDDRVLWISSDDPDVCGAPVEGVLRPAVRAVRDSLAARLPAADHLVLWTHAGPGNAWGLVSGALVFGMLGLFVMLWFSVVGQRVRAARGR